MTDAEGRYSFATIRPAGYPDSDLPAHVHMHVIEVGRCTYYIDDILFEDDPRLTKEKKAAQILDRGGSGLVKPRMDSAGAWVVRRDIHLGKNIPGYPERAQEPVPADGAARRRCYEPAAEAHAKRFAESLPAAIARVEEYQGRPFKSDLHVYVCASHESFTRHLGERPDSPARGMKLFRDIWVSPLAFDFRGSDTHGQTITHLSCGDRPPRKACEERGNPSVLN